MKATQQNCGNCRFSTTSHDSRGATYLDCELAPPHQTRIEPKHWCPKWEPKGKTR